MFVLFGRKFCNQHSRKVINQTNDANQASGTNIRDEQFFAVDHVVIAIACGRGPQSGEIGACTGFGESIRTLFDYSINAVPGQQVCRLAKTKRQISPCFVFNTDAHGPEALAESEAGVG